jgi:C4-type Zn-finger protein
MQDLTILAGCRYVHIYLVKEGECPVCHATGCKYDVRDFPHHYWVFFKCTQCGYELREHVMREMAQDPDSERCTHGAYTKMCPDCSPYNEDKEER